MFDRWLRGAGLGLALGALLGCAEGSVAPGRLGRAAQAQRDPAAAVAAWRALPEGAGPVRLSLGPYDLVLGLPGTGEARCECVSWYRGHREQPTLGCPEGVCAEGLWPAAGEGGVCVPHGAGRASPLRCPRFGNAWNFALRDTAMPPPGPLTSWHVGHLNGCGLDAEGRAWCVGLGPDAGPVRRARFVEVATAGPGLACGRRADGTVRCWGPEAQGELAAPPGAFVEQCVAPFHWCGLTAEGQVRCLGEDLYGETAVPAGPVYGALACGLESTCVAEVEGPVRCFGRYAHEALSPPEGLRARRLAVAPRTACALTPEGAVQCWGDLTLRREPDGAYVPALAPADTPEDPHWDGHFDAGPGHHWVPRAREPWEHPDF